MYTTGIIYIYMDIDIYIFKTKFQAKPRVLHVCARRKLLVLESFVRADHITFSFTGHFLPAPEPKLLGPRAADHGESKFQKAPLKQWPPTC